MTFEELMQDYVNEDYSVLVATAKKTFNEFYPVCKQIDKENDGFVLVTAIILSAVGADGKLTALETQFLKDVIGLTDDTIDNLIKLYTGKEEAVIDDIVDRLDDDLKVSIVTFVCCLCACDETIKREESAYIRRLIN